MSKRRRFLPNGTRRSGNVIHVSTMQMWEAAWVRKLGLEDVDWHPERDCEHCRAERAARGEAVEDITPPSGSRLKFLLLGDREQAWPSASVSRARRENGRISRHLKLVRSLRSKHKKP